MSLDSTLLENVKQHGTKTTARCPACKESNKDESGEHLFIGADGKFGCIAFPGPDGAGHRKRIFELVGTKPEPAATLRTGGKVRATLDDAITDAMKWDKGLLGARETRRDFYTPDFLEVRFDFDDGREKQYRPFHRNGAGYKMGDPAGQLPLYHRSELKPTGRVYVVEGPKCADAVAALGLCSTTSSHGAKAADTKLSDKKTFKHDWTPLAGHDVVILPDADKDGAAYAKTVTEILLALDPPATVRVVALPGLSGKQDVFDWLAAGHTAEELTALADAAPVEGMEWMKAGMSAADIGEMNLPELRFLVPNILPEGLNILAGRPKIGKSWLALDFALSVAYGGRAVGSMLVEKSAVLYLALEDGTRRMKDRLRHITAEALPPGLTFFFEWPHTDKGGLERLSLWLDQHPACRFVIVDTLQKIKAQSRFNSNAYEADYAAMEGLQRLAIQKRVCILLVHHLRKSGGDDILDSVSGSVGITGASDAVLILERGRGNADAVLHITGRDVTESRLALQFDAGRWKLLGDAEEHAISGTRRKILDALEDGPLTPKEIADAAGITHNNVRAMLNKMLSDQQVKRGEDHRYAALTVNSVNSYTPQVLTVQTSERVNGVNEELHPPMREVIL